MKYGIPIETMRDFVSFPILLLSFVMASSMFHWLVVHRGISGLASFLTYCVPFTMLIAWTTAGDGERFPRGLLWVVFWGYSFIIAVAAVARLPGLAATSRLP